MADYLHGRGPLTMNGVESLTYIKTNVSGNLDPGFPDVEIMQAFASLSFDTGGGTVAGLRLREDLVAELFKPLENTRAFFYLPMLLHPRSKGFMRLQSKHYLDYPIFEPNFYSDPRDLETLVAGMEEAIRLASQPSMQKLGAKVYTPTLPTCPSVVPGSHEYWRCWAMTISATFHHQVGTCKMGPAEDPTTVVDHTLRVHGFNNLRVADIGIIPQPPSGHTNSYSYMIGEKASDMIKETWDQPDNYYDSQFNSQGDSSSSTFNDLDYNLYQEPASYPPKYFEYRRKRAADGFDWQKSESSQEEEEVSQKVQVESGNATSGKQVKVIGSPAVAMVKGNVKPEKVVTTTATTASEKLSDLLSVLRPSEVDISHKSSLSDDHQATVDRVSPSPLAHEEKSALSELLELEPTVDEDGIRTVNLDNHTQFNKGLNKPQIVTDTLASAVNTTQFEVKRFPTDNTTHAVHLPVLDGKLGHEDEKVI